MGRREFITRDFLIVGSTTNPPTMSDYDFSDLENASADVHLWFVDSAKIKDRKLLALYSSWLSDDERTRLNRFHFARDRQQFLVARALLRYALAKFMGNIREVNIGLNLDDYGRPGLVESCAPEFPLAFNLSHTSGAIVLAISRVEVIGVDIQIVRPNLSLMDIANQYFSKNEHKQLRQLPEDKQIDRFFDLWTLKEAYIKAVGKGLAIPLDSFEFIFGEGQDYTFSIVDQKCDEKDQWHYWKSDFEGKYKVALALRNSLSSIRPTVKTASVIPSLRVDPISIGTFITNRSQNDIEN